MKEKVGLGARKPRTYLRFELKEDKVSNILRIQQKERRGFWLHFHNPTSEHMKEKNLLCIFHYEYGHMLVTCKNIYNQIKSTMNKGELLKYLKSKVPIKPIAHAWNTKGLTVQVENIEGVKTREARELFRISEWSLMCIRSLRTRTLSMKNMLLGEWNAI